MKDPHWVRCWITPVGQPVTPLAEGFDDRGRKRYLGPNLEVLMQAWRTDITLTCYDCGRNEAITCISDRPQRNPLNGMALSGAEPHPSGWSRQLIRLARGVTQACDCCPDCMKRRPA